MDPLCLIALKNIPDVGDITARKLIELFGDAKSVFTESAEAIHLMLGRNQIVANSILQYRDEALESAKKELEFIDRYNIRFLSWYEDDYPHRLRHCGDAPLFLFCKGSTLPNASRILAIVGTRKATDYGKNTVSQIVDGLKEAGVMIISGLALGIDSAAHKAALANEMLTIGVLGHGLDRIYPAENRKLAEQMLNAGALITENVSGVIPDGSNFPVRNRIIAGLSDAVLVAEAREKGGAMITAEIACSYNRDVFALPGKVTDIQSMGCNWLIRSNRAGLIRNADDILYFMNWADGRKRKVDNQMKLNIVLPPEEQKIYNLLEKEGECGLDYICNKLGFTINQAAMNLINLEFQGIVSALPGKMYRLI